MNNKLYEALESCLQALENGDSLDAALARHPGLESELRPILEAASQARGMSAPMPSADAMRRGKARLLQQAAEMREAKRPARRRQSVIPLFQRLAIALSLAAAALFSGTGLVQASSTALPGENLYPVKRTWEDMRLFFVFSSEAREAMEGEYEQERLDEVAELLREGRVVSITFSGVVSQVADNGLVVSGVPVALTGQTAFSGDPLTLGAAVIVTGRTDTLGHVSAVMVQVLPPGSVVPTGEREDESSTDGGESEGPQGNANEGRPESTFRIEGTLQSVNGNVWIIDGQTVYVENPALLGLVSVGMRVEVRGYFSADGRFIVTRVEVKGPESEHESVSPVNDSDAADDNANTNEDGNENENGDDNNNSDDSNDNSDVDANDNTNDNSNEDNSNQNANDNTNDNTNDSKDDNTNDSGGGDNKNDNGNQNDNQNGNENSNSNDD